MNIKIKTTFIAASIVIMLAAALGIIIVGRSSTDYTERLEQAGIYLESRDYDNAIAIYNRVIAENRTCAEAYAGLSEAYFAKNRTDKALEILEKGERNTDGDPIVIGKRDELFPDLMYASAPDDDDSLDYSEENAELTDTVTVSETEPDVTDVPQQSETETESETETSVSTTAETTVPTTAATTVPTTAAPVVVTTAPPVTTAAPPAATQATTGATTQVTTVPTTVTTTTVTTTEKLRDITVPDLTPMSLDEAYAWCSKNNINLNVVGSESDFAEILSQSPAPDSTVKENSSVIVVLAE